MPKGFGEFIRKLGGWAKYHTWLGKDKKEPSKDLIGPLEMVTEPIKRSDPKVGRNDPCSCGSGRKFKKCCRGNR